jgi:hypothetical protein
MRILIASSTRSSVCPTVDVARLASELRSASVEVDTFTLPFDKHSSDLLGQIAGVRLLEMSAGCDCLIAVAMPAYFLSHPQKINVFGKGSLNLGGLSAECMDPKQGLGPKLAPGETRSSATSLHLSQAFGQSVREAHMNLCLHDTVANQLLPWRIKYHQRIEPTQLSNQVSYWVNNRFGSLARLRKRAA